MMREKTFAKLVASVRQAGAIRRGDDPREPSTSSPKMCVRSGRLSKNRRPSLPCSLV